MNATQREILTAGVAMLADHGTTFITARNVADRIGRAHSGVTYYWPDGVALLDAVASEAIRLDNKMAVARLIADGHSSVASWGVIKRRRYLVELA